MEPRDAAPGDSWVDPLTATEASAFQRTAATGEPPAAYVPTPPSPGTKRPTKPGDAANERERIAEYERRMTCPKCGEYGDGCNCDAARGLS